MAEYNIQMNQKKEDGTWDQLYPKTKAAVVVSNDGKTLEAHVTDTSIHVAQKGDVTESTSQVLTITGGSGAVLGGGVSITVKKADASNDGYLSKEDYAAFNGKQDALGYIPANLAGAVFTGSVTLAGNPTQALEAATKQYVDAIKAGLDTKDSVLAATTENIVLSGLQTIDTVALQEGDRVLVKDQTTASENGIYIASSGTWTRAVDFSDGNVTQGAYTLVVDGSINKCIGFVLTTADPIVVGSSVLSFTEYSKVVDITTGTGLSKNGTQISISPTGIVAGTYTQVTVNEQGQVTSAANPTTLAGYGITDAASSTHTHADATESTSGFQSAADKIKLDGVAANATKTEASSTNGSVKINGTDTQVYIHPNDANTRHVTDTQISAWSGKQNAIVVSATEPAGAVAGDLYYAII